ncbi:MAG: hypothetical protein ACK559_39950, partial [bacterium]
RALPASLGSFDPVPPKGSRLGLRPLPADHQREDRPAVSSCRQPGGTLPVDQVQRVRRVRLRDLGRVPWEHDHAQR